jgi:hypothetical protein
MHPAPIPLASIRTSKSSFAPFLLLIKIPKEYPVDHAPSTGSLDTTSSFDPVAIVLRIPGNSNPIRARDSENGIFPAIRK